MAVILPLVFVLVLMLVPAVIAWIRGIETGIFRSK